MLAALGRAGTFLRNLDGQAEFHVKQVFFTSLPVMAGDGLSLYGMRNDVYIDITPWSARRSRRWTASTARATRACSPAS